MIEAMGKKCGLILTVEDNVLAGGFGSAVMELIESKGLPHMAVRRVGIPDIFVDHADQKRQRSLVGIDADGITATAREFLSQNPLRNSHAQTTQTAGHPSL
jgi:1-deoxy-D-xylulose-5-phosphate synthase